MTWTYSRVETDSNGNTFDHVVQPGGGVEKDVKLIPRGATIYMVDHGGRKSFCEIDLPLYVLLQADGLNTNIIIEADIRTIIFTQPPKYFRAGLPEGWMLHVFNDIHKPTNPDFFQRRNHTNIKAGSLV